MEFNYLETTTIHLIIKTKIKTGLKIYETRTDTDTEDIIKEQNGFQ